MTITHFKIQSISRFLRLALDYSDEGILNPNPSQGVMVDSILRLNCCQTKSIQPDHLGHSLRTCLGPCYIAWHTNAWNYSFNLIIYRYNLLDLPDFDSSLSIFFFFTLSSAPYTRWRAVWKNDICESTTIIF